MSTKLEEISAALQAGRMKLVKQLVEEALTEGVPAKDILQNGLMAGMDVVAEGFKNGDLYVPEVLVAARAMNAGTALLKPHLAEAGAQPLGKAVIGTVKGDLHDIGKNLVRMMFEGKGIEVVDLGTDVSAEQFLEAFKENNADIVACSALLTTTMNEMGRVVEIFTEAGLRGGAVIMVGGAPVNESFCHNIGADIYTADAASAAEAARQAILKKRSA